MTTIVKSINIFQHLFLIVLVINMMSCKKMDDWLDIKRQKNDVSPSSLTDCQALLDNDNIMNTNYPQVSVIGTDNIYINDQNLSANQYFERNAYLWQKDIYEGGSDYDWQYAYQRIEYPAIVLAALSKIDRNDNNSKNYDNVKGSALFFRSMTFYDLAQAYCKPFDSSSYTTDLGIPIRISSDVNIAYKRGTLKQVYDQVIDDLTIAVDLLPETPVYKTRPSKQAAEALLSKIYLVTGNWKKSIQYSQYALQTNNSLIDFNGTYISYSSTYSFPTFSTADKEIIFYAQSAGYRSLWAYDLGYVDTSLYNMYDSLDLRKEAFYSIDKVDPTKIYFKGSYTGNYYNFSGIGVNEVLLTLAEAQVRKGDYIDGLASLSSLLSHRYKTGHAPLLAVQDASGALKLVLEERRKELPLTGQVRWEDLRRLNKNPITEKTIYHNYNSQVYILAPNSNKYTFPIPALEITLNGLEQNERN